MAATTTAVTTIKDVLNTSQPDKLADAVGLVNLGDTLVAIDETITIASGTTINLLTQSTAKKDALILQSVRVVTGTATGQRTVGDAGSTPSTTLVSFNGTTITFEAAITVARCVWIPKSPVALTTAFAT